ncbi:MAG: homoserine dehydrogenase [Oscillospiraceae bacterium]|nr:homoserine dehydrogenase [Oscillospiraceae bacterium]
MAKIALLGYGTVGSGVAEVLHKNAASIARKAAEEITIKYILDMREFPDDPFGDLVVHDFSIIEQDPEIAVVVECIGGATVALDYVRRALLAGKDVVTSNKELVATHGHELLMIAKQKSLNFLFEASVGGGIPILRPLTSCLAANDLTEICGILNGTTNFILTKMFKEGKPFDEVLKIAQEKGYAERNPAADIEGTDACRKICILAALAFGRHVYPEQVPTTGITAITGTDVAFAAESGMTVKLLGRAIRREDGKICAYVAPHFVPLDNQLANVEDVFNGIVVCGDAIGDVMFYGRGAGKLPTASAVVADVIDATKHHSTKKFLDWAEGGPDVVADMAALPMRWFIRTTESLLRIGKCFGDAEVMSRVIDGQVGFFTPKMPKCRVDEILSGGFSAAAPIPILA